MMEWVIAGTILLASCGAALVAWTIVDTRNRYYREFISRRRNSSD